ncbi:PspA/IM30 family protein [Alkalihalobacillus pseudalcaliphilus]|uniref:PspA/IM30 family protein n=1 Tax=Alkalihalobacillus pseudalcaliphilus TaxID=79884 RepID=UPI00064DABE3|nr:PspA/IM30 family protein [Alkalihalobacillus pseudalcaliphilus]KMK75696.1 hypothetical protein AB990_10450 [Alkalihalobacillus pseudalcaliphilus]
MAFTRIKRYLFATIHEGLDKVEDPVIMVKQYLRELKEEIQKKEKAIDKQEHMQYTLERDKREAEAIVEKRDHQAKQAIDANEEGLAKKALLSKREAYEEVIRYQELLEASSEHIVELKKGIELLQKKYQQLRDKRMELELRKEATLANHELKKSMQRHSYRNLERSFHHLEDELDENEWKWRSKQEQMDGPTHFDEEIEHEYKQLIEAKNRQEV